MFFFLLGSRRWGPPHVLLLKGLMKMILPLQAREYLHHKIFGGQQITPVAIMTSAAKDNHARVQALLAVNNHFGRGEESFRLACTLAADACKILRTLEEL